VVYLAFDIIGDLAFGAPFGMLEAAKDIAIAPKHYGNHKAVMASYGKQEVGLELIGIPAAQILAGRGEYAMCMGVLPPYCRPFVSQLPGYRFGKECTKDMAGISIMAVAKRLANPSNRADLLNKLQSGRDVEGKPMGREELTSEAQSFLIAGSDTTSK
jgi:benzoate 4-monooxygenase